MTTRERNDRWLRAFLLLLALLGLAAVAIPFFLTPPATLDLLVTDAVFASPLTEEAVRLVDLATGKEMVAPMQELPEGARVLVPRIRSGESRFEVAVEGFEPAVIEIEAAPLAVVREKVPLTPTFAQLAVSVVNARLPDAPLSSDLKIRVGDREESGEGTVLFSRLPPGSYQVTAEASDFCEAEREATVERGQRRELLIPLPPALVRGERVRAILDWGENPRDLDAHVMLSDSSVPLTKSHVYFGQKTGEVQGGGSWADLDVDWLHSESFETITIYDRADGVYQYFVHNYSGDGTIGGAEATVEIFTAGCRRERVTVDRDCDPRWWYVADLRATGEEVQLVERNDCQERMPYSWDLLRKASAAGS